MATPSITLAKYSIMIGDVSSGTPGVVLQALQANANLPGDLHAFVGELEPRKTIRWQNAEILTDHGDGRLELKLPTRIANAVLLPLDEFFNGTPGGSASHRQALARALPTLNDPSDLLMAAYNQITAAFMRNYPGAGVMIENDEIVVSSDTSLPTRGSAAPRATAPTGPRRPKAGREGIRVWI